MRYLTKKQDKEPCLIGYSNMKRQTGKGVDSERRLRTGHGLLQHKRSESGRQHNLIPLTDVMELR